MQLHCSTIAAPMSLSAPKEVPSACSSTIISSSSTHAELFGCLRSKCLHTAATQVMHNNTCRRKTCNNSQGLMLLYASSIHLPSICAGTGIDQLIDQLINQSIHQSIDQSMNQSFITQCSVGHFTPMMQVLSCLVQFDCFKLCRLECSCCMQIAYACALLSSGHALSH